MGNQLNLYLNTIFEINQRNKRVELKQVSFLNGRYEAIYLYEKHFLNVYRVFDKITHSYKNLKLFPILTEVKQNISKEDIENYIRISQESLINLEYYDINESRDRKSCSNTSLVNIEDFYFDYSNNTYTNLLVIEEPIDFITFNDFLLILKNMQVEDFQNLFGRVST
jgi:hypothetical protein